MGRQLPYVGLVTGRGTWSWIVPDGLWEIAEPLIPPSKVRPRGGGPQDTPDETLFAAIIYVLVSGCAWRALPPPFGMAKKRGEITGPSPVDRGKPGSKTHVLSDANGLPLLVGLSAANTHDSLALKPMITGHQTRHDPHRGRYFKPQRLHADKAYDIPHLHKMAMRQAHRRAHRPQGSRVQRTVRPPQMGHRADHVLADRLPQAQPPL